MNMRRRGSVQKEIRDYIVPIVWLLLIIILIFSVFSGDDESSNQLDLENKVWIELSLNSSNTESFIEYPWDYKKQIEWDISLYKWEKVIVKNGTVSLSMLWLWDFRLNKLWEFKYLENGDFSLYSSDLWINSVSWINVNMSYASVKVWDNTHISFSQNEMGSTVYLINWFVEVTNLVWESTVLASGQKITVSRLDASSEDIDLSLQKENIDDYYKQSDWFILNNWSRYLNLSDDDSEESSTWTTISSVWFTDRLINLTNLSDEANVSSDTIVISWNFEDEEITKITLNWDSAAFNSELKTFKFENVSVANRENDLVFKVYDDANDLLSKFIYTVYFDGATSASNTTSKFKVQTFDVDGSQFTFTTIKDWVSKQLNWKTTYTTYWDFLTIYWNVTAKWIDSVSIDWYTLKSFNWSSWRYHPSIINNNLNIWTNVYEIKYYDENWKVLYTNHFTIIKKAAEIKTEETYSNEAKIEE